MNRRQLIGALSVGGVVAATSSPAVMAAALVAKPKPEPLPKLRAGDVLSERWLNEMAERVNELSAA